MSSTDTGLPTQTMAARAVGITKIYGQGETAVRALDDVTVGFPAGRFTAVMGPSGSGKSTLMHCMAGLDKVTSGQVWIGDTELSDLSDRQLTMLRREKVGFVFQAFNLLPTLTAAENIELPLSIAGRKPDGAWYDRVIDAVGLRHRLGHRLDFMRRSVDEFGQTIVMVTHDPTAAAYADRVLFLADGRIVDEMEAPTAGKVLDFMKKLGG